MIKITTNGVEDLWEELAKLAITEKAQGWDLSLGSRAISYLNRFEIRHWKANFDARAFYWAMGYELHGSKMTTLYNSYIDPDEWKAFRAKYQERKGASHYSLGMNFKRKPEGKGGCLSCFELVGNRRNQFLYLHSKTIEFPKKFTADVRLISRLLWELDIEDIKVYWSSSVVWKADQFLKGIRTVFGNAYFQALTGKERAQELTEYMPGYVEPTQRRIANHYKQLSMFQQESGMEVNENGDFAEEPKKVKTRSGGQRKNR